MGRPAWVNAPELWTNCGYKQQTTPSLLLLTAICVGPTRHRSAKLKCPKPKVTVFFNANWIKYSFDFRRRRRHTTFKLESEIFSNKKKKRSVVPYEVKYLDVDLSFTCLLKIVYCTVGSNSLDLEFLYLHSFKFLYIFEFKQLFCFEDKTKINHFIYKNMSIL